MNSTSPQASNSIDLGAQRVGAVYAKALLGASEKAGASAAVLEELQSLVADVLDRHPAFEAILGTARIAAEEKESLLDRTLGNQASKLVLNFLKVLARHGRLDSIREVVRSFQEQHDVLRGRVAVVISTAAPLPEAELRQLTDRVRGLVRGEPRIEQRVDPSLIGGVVLRVGDTVYDGSVVAQLERARGEMIDRSVHEIQSRRDRFRTAS